MTRILIALLAFGAMSALTSTAAAPEETKVPKDTCVKPCFDCARECLTGTKHARDHLKMEDLAKSVEVCHHACLMCAHAVGGKTARAWEICELCEKICNDCAAACEKSNDEHMKKCAQACRDCAKACADARK